MTVHPYTRLFISATPPTVNDDVTLGYEVGDVIHVTSGGVYECRDATDGAAVWEPRRLSLTAARTYYVRTDGSDSNTGLVDSAGGAFLTIQKAYNTIATIDKNGYAITIQVGTGTFAEALTVYTGIGEGTVTLQGALTAQETVTSATVAAGTGATQGTVTKAGAFTGNVYANMLAYFVTDAVYRIIDSHTDDVLTLVGTATSSTTQNVIIYDWGTIVSSITATTGKTASITSISITGITKIQSYSKI